MISFPKIQSEIQFLEKKNDIEISILREDQIHAEISGNKFRKLKYNLEAFSKGNHDALLTFGGAYSNHISATAAAGKVFGVKTIGIIRGEELAEKINENPTLTFAQSCGMHLKFISREQYRNKNSPEFLDKLKSEFGNIYILPEGGTNELAVKGCEEILRNHTKDFDFICCPVGTGGTISGLINSAENHQKVLGFPALKDSDYLVNEINRFTNRSHFELISDYHFGGYAKVKPELLDFVNGFKAQFDVTLDAIYTGKMMFGIYDLIENGYFPPKSKILAVHTGGIQGNAGMNQKLKQKNKKLIV
ncbi:1-aminocyclopropane-1-carboxylate deaminase/D-cysteine desulfhydrase [Moheibacter lacus]|uniref:1-aminocyclopropane-1-carboxylate deaminase/D-cysteine desulfhydrase n=1 Tax=Moheibacter lacus TaxID=2745851 RepID=A0A838ZUH5_9FLAO|nr:pyridoxal-phosphate dependent enzyme [Moheibacter lacus]MBA5630640.1 1-aminocyclopropane-1-carboxylate deaminase/D-cysteine desulfhydrase [Moheibacter lacus]